MKVQDPKQKHRRENFPRLLTFHAAHYIGTTIRCIWAAISMQPTSRSHQRLGRMIKQICIQYNSESKDKSLLSVALTVVAVYYVQSQHEWKMRVWVSARKNRRACDNWLLSNFAMHMRFNFHHLAPLTWYVSFLWSKVILTPALFLSFVAAERTRSCSGLSSLCECTQS